MDTPNIHTAFTEAADPSLIPGVLQAPSSVDQQSFIPTAEWSAAPPTEPESLWLKARKFGGRAALAAVCMIPVADVAASDAVSAKVYEVSAHTFHSDHPRVERAITDGIVFGDIVGESMLLNLIMARSRRLKGASEETEEYFEKRQSEMSRPRKALSRVLNAPMNALIYAGEKLEALGNRVAAHKSPIARGLGKLAIDAGKVNSIGTAGVSLQETMAGSPPSKRRSFYLSSLFATTWLAGAEGIRELYTKVPAVQPPMDKIFETFTTMTSVDNPYGATAVGGLAVCLMNTGWNIAMFHESRAAEPTPETVDDDQVG